MFSNEQRDLTPLVSLAAEQLSLAKVLAKGFLVSSAMFTTP